MSFALPGAVARNPGAQAAGGVPVSISLNAPSNPNLQGKLAFIENSVDSGAGTIGMKAVFANKGGNSGRACSSTCRSPRLHDQGRAGAAHCRRYKPGQAPIRVRAGWKPSGGFKVRCSR